MNHKLMQTLFTLSIFGLLLLGVMLITGHLGFALTFSQYLFGLISLSVVIYIYSLHK